MNEELAVPRPVIAPSDAEREACERLATISTDGCEEKAKAAKLKATLTFSDAEPSPAPPTWLQRQHDSRVKALEADILRLRTTQEPA